jgi:mRNA-degrading endonuclease RelE of RelBE toxin-antitoxin system
VKFVVLFRQSAAEFLNALPEKSQRIVREHLIILKTDPYPGRAGDKERLNTIDMDVYRLHLGRSFTALYLIHTDKNMVEITHLMSTEQAHKRYGRL